MDITIKDVPSGAEEGVKALSMVAIERFLSAPLQPSATALKTFQDALDAILIANDLPAKFAITEEAK